MDRSRPTGTPRQLWRQTWLFIVASLYLFLSTYQLGLPGLHYDEAREAGVNAMELLTGAPVTAFRGASVALFGVQFPLMVQDYIGALNVYLSLPFLALTGIGVPNLRFLAVLTGLVALLLLERCVSEWRSWWDAGEGHVLPVNAAAAPARLTLAGLFAISLLAFSPSFIFWSRQGVFVTNLTQPLCLLCVWQGVRWLRTGQGRSLALAAFAAGCALYAKLLAVWLIAPFFLLALFWQLGRARRGLATPRLTGWGVLLAIALFLLPLTPLALFVWQTDVLVSFASRLSVSYYGVDNLAIGENLLARLGQLAHVLAGDHLWYLGGVYGNGVAPWLALILLLLGAAAHWRLMLAPFLLLASATALSIFTLSDLFITHYALMQPFVIGAVALAAGVWLERGAQPSLLARLSPQGRKVVVALMAAMIAVWLILDLWATVNYHRAVAMSGGLADHSDASYHLAYHLRMNGMGAPIVLDWGMDAPVRYLSAGAVTPIEIFGYESLQQPDAAFDERLGHFLDNPENVYLLHAPGREIFRGRRAAFLAAVESRSAAATVEAVFAQRNGEPLFELWKVNPVQR